MAREEKIVLIEDWSLVIFSDDPLKTPYFQGKFYGHKSIPDGEMAITSRIIVYFPNRNLFKSLNALYRLGTVNPEYEKQFPDVYKRILQGILK